MDDLFSRVPLERISEEEQLRLTAVRVAKGVGPSLPYVEVLQLGGRDDLALFPEDLGNLGRGRVFVARINAGVIRAGHGLSRVKETGVWRHPMGDPSATGRRRGWRAATAMRGRVWQPRCWRYRLKRGGTPGA